jgi:hypothetical protein
MSLWYVWHKPSTYLTPTLTLSQKQIETRFHDSYHLGVLSGASNIISKPIVCSTQTVHQSCIKSCTLQNDRSERSLEPRHLEVPSSASKMIYIFLWYVRCKPCTRLALTLTLSPNGVKRNSTRPTSLTSSFGCVQNYLCLWYVQLKPCTYLVSRLALYRTSPSSPRSTLGCV